MMTKKELVNELLYMIRFGESEYAMKSDSQIATIIENLIDSYTEEGGEERL